MFMYLMWTFLEIVRIFPLYCFHKSWKVLIVFPPHFQVYVPSCTWNVLILLPPHFQVDVPSFTWKVLIVLPPHFLIYVPFVEKLSSQNFSIVKKG